MQENNSGTSNEKSLWVALSFVQSLGSQTFCQLLKAFGDPANIFATPFKQLAEIVTKKLRLILSKVQMKVCLKTPFSGYRNPVII